MEYTTAQFVVTKVRTQLSCPLQITVIIQMYVLLILPHHKYGLIYGSCVRKILFRSCEATDE